MAIMADGYAVGYGQAALQKGVVFPRAVAPPVDDVARDPVPVVVADQEADPATRLLPGHDRTWRFQLAKQPALDLANGYNVALAAGWFSRWQGKYRNKPIAIGDHQGSVIDEIETVDLAQAFRRQLHEVMDGDLRTTRRRIDVDPQDQTAPSRISRNCQQPIVRRKAQIFRASDGRERGSYGIAGFEVDPGYHLRV
ncbi:hypothetical protein [Mesorhizobium sp. M9A.F.Ca.ET.002.03.1.2]|uniref:hypothetical protein n=1 Tax=Mesorhizobium sp. M9A.F.Ca.ET.002.03.1.2 TaxID=2493668 RepID=UPI001FE06F9B|nr:hypothetical protein [Mesorhizobium sp. M9A.F.Ca.ET.002.03.1.2]